MKKYVSPEITVEELKTQSIMLGSDVDMDMGGVGVNDPNYGTW